MSLDYAADMSAAEPAPSDSNNNSISNDTRNNDLLMVEHFGFVPIAFIDDVVNAINELLYIATSQFETFIRAQQGSGEHTELGMNKLETLLEGAIDRHFDLLELYLLREIFVVRLPQGILLPHQAGADTSATSEEVTALDAQLAQTRAALTQATKFNHCIKQLLRVVRRQNTHVQRLHTQVAHITASKSPAAAESLGEQVAYIVAQTRLLEQRVTQLASAAQPLPNVTTPTPREAYLNAVAQNAIAASVAAGTAAEDDSIRRQHRKLLETGSVEAIQAVQQALAGTAPGL